MSKELLVTPEEYLKSGIHIGTRYKTKGMRKFIFKLRKDGLKVFSIETIDDRVRYLAKFLANYDADKIAVVGRRIFAQTAVEHFCKIISAKPYIGRFIPGKFTNPKIKGFFEPQLIFVIESNLDKQVICEAQKINVPVVSLSSANNSLTNIDFTLPCNNKGKKSLALIFWLLTREYQFAKGIIKSRDDFKHKAEEFEFSGKEKIIKKEEDRRGRRPFRGRRKY
ncbi:MAG: 30S ribosomal protein S2 [Candidatus Diapherotrites archaeon CG08_land_8_20_14_0_20_30_16]|nr:MAG: 30S ribosomal protein S2 [Candidatus Diapherotrites archaeon CG08_land_8_20_14_0_20_30_16]